MARLRRTTPCVWPRPPSSSWRYRRLDEKLTKYFFCSKTLNLNLLYVHPDDGIEPNSTNVWRRKETNVTLLKDIHSAGVEPDAVPGWHQVDDDVAAVFAGQNVFQVGRQLADDGLPDKLGVVDAVEESKKSQVPVLLARDLGHVAFERFDHRLAVLGSAEPQGLETRALLTKKRFLSLQNCCGSWYGRNTIFIGRVLRGVISL